MVNNSDPTFYKQLILWTAANGISMISTWALIIAILRSPKVRTKPFNLYLVFSILPDAYKNTAGFAANLANLLRDSGDKYACTVIGWNDVYWWCANLWMACVVFGHLHKMLLAAKRLKRHGPPKLPRVIKESVAVHIFSLFMATLTLIPVDWIPKATPMSGCEAYPEDKNTAQYIFYWVFFMPATSLIPTFWVTGLCFDIWWRKMLPVNGKTRSLLFYFARLLTVIYIVVIAVIISFAFGGWVQAIAFVAFNLVGFFSVCLALIKNDVKKCWISMWKCQPPDEGLVSSRTGTGDGGPSETSVEEGANFAREFSFFRRSTSRFMQSMRSVRGSFGSRRVSRGNNNINIMSVLSNISFKEDLSDPSVTREKQAVVRFQEDITNDAIIEDKPQDVTMNVGNPAENGV